MKKFIFKYERILDVRIALENELKNNLGKVNKIILDKEDELEIAIGDNNSYFRYVEEIMKDGVRAADLRSVEHHKEYLNSKITGIKQAINTLVAKRTEIQRDLVEANKQRKVMEKIREKDYEEYLDLEAAEEAKVIDEIVTYTSTRKRGE